MKKKSEKKEYLFEAICMIFPFLWGGFHELSAYIMGVVIVIGITVACVNSGRIKYVVNSRSVLLLLYVACYWSVIIVAVDRGVALLGAVKFTVPLLFYVLMMQWEEQRRERVISLIPLSGTIMIVLCLAAGIIPELRDLFYQAGRLGGFFQYSNTMALYFLIGIVIVGFRKCLEKLDYLEAAVLILGIMMTGSRTVFVLMMLVFLYFMAFHKELRKKLLIVTGVLVLAAVLYTALTGDFQNIGRFLSISRKSSTLLGRILYNIDGLQLLMKHPFGLGYMGYSILQPSVQTGVYTTMFVHNDWLQTALDAGITAGIALLILVMCSLFSKSLSGRNKLIIFIMGVHMLFDFDIQYLAIFFILILAMGCEQRKREIRVSKEVGKKVLLGFMMIPGCLYTYCGIVSFLAFIGCQSAADNMYPFDSRIKTDLMLESSSTAEANRLADEIIGLDEYSYAAYNIKAVVALEDADYQEMIRYKRKGLSITKYDIAEYEDYILMLKKAIDNTAGEEQREYIQYLLEVNDMLEQVKRETNPIAYQIKDKPELELPKEFQDYIAFFE